MYLYYIKVILMTGDYKNFDIPYTENEITNKMLECLNSSLVKSDIIDKVLL